MLEGQNLESQDAATTIKVRQMNNRYHVWSETSDGSECHKIIIINYEMKTKVNT